MAACFFFTPIFSQTSPTNQKIASFYHQNPISFSKTLTPKTPPKPYITPKCASPQTLSYHSSFIKPTIITITTAALLLSRFSKPSIACPPSDPNRSFQTLTLDDIDTETEQSIEKLRSFLDAKIKSNDIPGAISIIDRLVELEHENLDLPLLKCSLLIQSGDTHLAKQLLEQIISRDPFSVDAYHGLVMANREAEESLDGVLERVENVMKTCEKEKRREDLRDFKLLKAEIKIAEGKYEEGIRVYEELRKEEPTDFRVYLCEGVVYMLMRKKDEAEKWFEKYRRLVPKGHTYARYFEDGVISMKLFGEMVDGRRGRGLKI